MAKLTIIDTGFPTSDRDGTPVSGTNIATLSTYRANGGSAITLSSAKINLRSGVNIADEPNPNSNDAARVHFTSFNNRIFEIDFIINIQDSTDRLLLKEIAVLERTTGVKLLYASSTSDILKTIPELIGRTDTRFNGKEIGSEIPVIVGRVIGTQINQISTSRKFQISGTLTFEEEKVII